jgi:hypothetical protein
VVSSWVPIDTWNLATPDTRATADLMIKGRFAFLLKEGEELWIQNLLYYPPVRAASRAPAPAAPPSGRNPEPLPASSRLQPPVVR